VVGGVVSIVGCVDGGGGFLFDCPGYSLYDLVVWIEFMILQVVESLVWYCL
jgi:hypothetical protein